MSEKVQPTSEYLNKKREKIVLNSCSCFSEAATVRIADAQAPRRQPNHQQNFSHKIQESGLRRKSRIAACYNVERHLGVTEPLGSPSIFDLKLVVKFCLRIEAKRRF